MTQIGGLALPRPAVQLRGVDPYRGDVAVYLGLDPIDAELQTVPFDELDDTVWDCWAPRRPALTSCVTEWGESPQRLPVLSYGSGGPVWVYEDLPPVDRSCCEHGSRSGHYFEGERGWDQWCEGGKQ